MRAKARKSIFTPKGKKTVRIKKAVKHDVGERTFGRSFHFECFDNRQGEFSEDIEVLLNSFILNATKVLTKMDIQQPVHRFHRPFHTGMMQQLQCSQFSAGDIVMPFTGFLSFFFKFRVDCANTAQTWPCLPVRNPFDIAGDKCCSLLNPAPVLLFFLGNTKSGCPLTG